MINIANLNVPENWSEVSFGTYQLLVGLELGKEDTKVGELENSIKILATLLRTNIKVIEELSSKDFMTIQSKVKFLSKEIVHTSKVKWNFIPVNKLSMDKWMAYERYKTNPEENLAKILALLQPDYNEAQIKEMAVTEVLRGFFILQRNSNKYMRHFQLYSTKVILKASLKKYWMEKKEWVKKKLRIK